MQWNHPLIRLLFGTFLTAVLTNAILADEISNEASSSSKRAAGQSDRRWYSDLDEAKQVARKLQHPVMIVFR